jgi:hypothetical protein
MCALERRAGGFLSDALETPDGAILSRSHYAITDVPLLRVPPRFPRARAGSSTSYVKIACESPPHIPNTFQCPTSTARTWYPSAWVNKKKTYGRKQHTETDAPFPLLRLLPSVALVGVACFAAVAVPTTQKVRQRDDDVKQFQT